MTRTRALSVSLFSLFASVTTLLLTASLSADDWTAFRGSARTGHSSSETAPLTWSDDEHVKWKIDLPGPGSSSPIVLGNRVFVTSYSGYGTSKTDIGKQEDLKRHLTCVDRGTGDVVWQKDIDPVLPEAKFTGFHVEHGYATNTPATDGKRIYAFFGKPGVFAFDLLGKQLWQVGVGAESFSKKWGSATSLVLHENLVIVNASTESHSLRALDRATGKEVWRVDSKKLDLTFGTPRIVQVGDHAELLIAVPGEVWGLDPATGKQIWFAESPVDGNASPDVVVGDGVVYAYGGYPVRASIAIRLGGTGDVTDSHVVWSSKKISSYVGTPLLHEGHLYWVTDKGVAMCIAADSGDVVYQERLSKPTGGSFGNRPFYASPILAGDRYYSVSRNGGTLVVAAKPKFELLHVNVLAQDDSDFSGTPAIVDGQIFLRSYRSLYCIE